MFDLDGTLLPLDIENFIEKYFGLITEEFSDLCGPKKLIDILMQSTGAMIDNSGNKTNKEVFELSFFNRISVDDKNKILARFDEFYKSKFPLLKSQFKFDYNAAELISMLQKQDYKLVLATNPVFPRQAIWERIKWTNVNPAVFDFITSYENMHYSKPNINYYKELLAKIDEEPTNCVMVGNDVKEDMIAGELGITTFLIENYKINADNSCEPDWQGSFSELKKVLKSL